VTKAKKDRPRPARPAAEAPPLEPPPPPATFDWKWTALGVPLLVMAAALGYLALSDLPPIKYLVYPLAALPVLGAGFALGWFARGRRILQAGIAAIAVFAIATLMLPMPAMLVVERIDPFGYYLAVVTLAFDLAVLGAFIGEAIRHPKRKGDLDAWDTAGKWLAEHGALYALAHVTIAVMVIHAHVFAGEVIGDDLSFHYAESVRLADCLRVGDFDFWNPSANAGYASAYYYQAIPQLASAIPSALFGHQLFFFQLSVFLPLVVAPAAAYRGMRLLGASPWTALVAAFAIGFMNGESRWGAGNAGTFQVGLYTQTWALCAFPLALGHGARWIADAKGLAPAIAWGAFVGLCHPFAVIVLGVGLATSVIAQLLPRLDKLAWPSIVGRTLICAGIALWLLVPHGPIPELAFAITGSVMIAGGLALPIALLPPGVAWERPDVRRCGRELGRTLILGAAMVIAWLPVWLPLVVDMVGFGGFPHRVADEVGPGFYGLGRWYRIGALLDWAQNGRIAVLTWSLPVAIILCRARILRWLWPPALLYAALLGLGPHIGKIGDDLFPPVRALGAMQIVIGLGLGVCAIAVGRMLWDAPWDAWFAKLLGSPTKSSSQYAMRTLVSALAAGLLVLVAVPGARALAARVSVMGDNPAQHRDEMMEINDELAKLPPGRKQTGPGAENHWWNLLSYVYERVPSTLQMGGGGLQASPNYDFLWTQHDYLKNAWVYDAPYVVFNVAREKNIPDGETMYRTKNFEIRRFPAPGLVSPVQIIGILPPGGRTGEAGHVAALEWLTGRDSGVLKRWVRQFGTTLDGDEAIHDRLLAYEGSEGLMARPAGKMLRAWHQPSPGDDADIVAEVETTAPTTFVIRESWHPRWRAYVDGAPAPVRRVTPDFPAVDVGTGKHTIELRFERPWWALAAWLAWPGVPLAAWLVIRRRRKKQAAAS